MDLGETREFTGLDRTRGRGKERDLNRTRDSIRTGPAEEELQ